MTTPKVTEMKVIPVAGYDSMEMTLSGAHAPFFTRNIVILKDSANHTGIGEIHGGEYTKECLESYIPLVVGEEIGKYRSILGRIHRGGKKASEDDGEGIQTLDISKLKFVVRAEWALECALLDLLGQHLGVMDSTAASMCNDNHIPILVFSLADPHNIVRAVQGEEIGTIVD